MIAGVLNAKSLPSRIQLAIIPCGTGNALANTLGLSNPEQALKHFLQSSARPLMIHTVFSRSREGGPLRRIKYSFCVVSWGFHAQVVRQSEWLRFMGQFRFLVNTSQEYLRAQLAAFWNLIRLKTYSCQFGKMKQGGSTEPVLEKQEFTYFLSTKVDSLKRSINR